MRTYVPDYYHNFKCIASKCKHTCCQGWEIEIDNDSLKRFSTYSDIKKHIEYSDASNSINEQPHFKLKVGEVCPFLQDNGLCKMIITHGEDMLCQTCTDHPRFRNYWADRIEMGIGLVCEEAARIILSSDHPLKLVNAENTTYDFTDSSEDEQWLIEERNFLLSQITDNGPFARLKEYLIYRHIPDALYDDRLEERIQYIDYLIELIKDKYNHTDKSFENLIECAREISYDYEYDEEMKEKLLNKFYIENAELVLLTEDDKEDIYALYQSALGSPGCVWTESYPSRELLDEDIETHNLYGLFSNAGELIAAIAIDRDEEVEKLPYWSKSLQPSKEVARLVVSLEYRNLGIARNMIKKIMPILKAMGNKSIHYMVSDDNPQAKRSYESLKFNEVGHTHMYDEDFTCYEKEL